MSVGFLYLDFEPGFYFWEIIVFIRKIAILLIGVVFPITTSLNVRMLVSTALAPARLPDRVLPQLLCLVVFVGCVLQIRYMPYVRSRP